MDTQKLRHSFNIESKVDAIITIAVFFSVFISSWTFFKYPFEFYLAYVPMILLIPFFIAKYRFPKWLVFAFMYLLIVGVVQVFAGNNTYAQFFKIFLGIFFSVFFYDGVIKSYRFDIPFLFKMYLKGAFFMAVIALIQYLSFKIGFKPGYDYSWFLNKYGVNAQGTNIIRISGMYSEPSQMAIVQSPAMFVALYTLFTRNFQYYSLYQIAIIIFTYTLTFSSVGYAGIFVITLLLLINYGVLRYLFLLIPVGILTFYVLYKNVPDFTQRVDDTIYVFTTSKYKLGKTHGSSIILYDNFQVATTNLWHNPITGTGLGSHFIAFHKYSVTKQIHHKGFMGNQYDANSLFLRIMSENGIIGIVLVFVFIYSFYIGRSADLQDEYWVISNAMLVIMLLFLLRQGHYFINGFPLFILMYYYNKVQFNLQHQVHAA